MSNEEPQCRLNYPFNRFEKYVVRLDYIQAPDNFIPAFMFGLSPDCQDFMGNSQMSFHEAEDKWGISKQIKGIKLYSGYPTINLRKSYEMRIDLQNSILRVGSLPGYNSVVELKEKNRLEKHEL